MKIPKRQHQEAESEKFQHFQQEIFTPRESHDPKAEEVVVKLNYESLNDFFNLIVYLKTKSLWVGLGIIFFINVILTSIIFIFSSQEFIIGFYYLPLGLFYLFVWGYIKKSELQIQRQLLLNLIAFIIFGISFFCIYFIIFHPLLHQQFNEGSQCIVENYKSTSLGANKKNQYSVLTISFVDADGNSQIGCGCISTKSDSTILSSSPFPYNYIEKNEKLEFTSSGSTEQEYLGLMLPSWFCASSIGSITEREIQVLDQAENKIKLKECYYNNYLGYQKSDKNTNQNICYDSSQFLQVIFKEIPNYDVAFFHVMIALIYEPFICFSFQWIAIILSFLLRRCIRKSKEPKRPKIYKKAKEVKHKNYSAKVLNQVLPDISMQESSQNESVISKKNKSSQNYHPSLLNAVSNPELDNSQLNNTALSHLQHNKIVKEHLVAIHRKIKLQPLNLDINHKKPSKNQKKNKK